MCGGDLMKTWLWGKHAGRCLVALTACGLIACSEDRGQDGIDGRVAAFAVYDVYRAKSCSDDSR